MKKLMDTKPVLHAVIWIILYIITMNIGGALAEMTGAPANLITGAMMLVLSVFLVLYLRKDKKLAVFGIKGIAKGDFRKTLFYVPLIIIENDSRTQ